MMEKTTSGVSNEPTITAGLFGGAVAQFSFREKRLDTAADVKDFLALVEERSNDDGGELEGISFSSNSVGVDAAEAIGTTLQRLKSMRAAYMANIFGSRNLDEIPPALDFLVRGYLLSGCSLIHIDFSDNAFGAAALSRLTPLFESETLVNVQEIIFNNNGLGQTGGTLLAECLRRLYDKCRSIRDESQPPPLRRFVCGRNRLENVGSKALSEVLPLYAATLEHVQIPQNGIFEKGMETFLKSLGAMSNLRVLDIEDNCVKDAGTRMLVENMPKWKKLERLNLSSTLLGSQNAVRVCEALATNCAASIQNLQLNACEIDDSAVIDELADSFCHFSAIEEISLIDNWDMSFSKLSDIFCDSFEARDCMDYIDVLVLKDEQDDDEYENVSDDEGESESFDKVGDDNYDEARSGEVGPDGEDATDDEESGSPVALGRNGREKPPIPGPLPGMKFGDADTTAASKPFSFSFTTLPPELPSFSFASQMQPTTTAATASLFSSTSKLFTATKPVGNTVSPFGSKFFGAQQPSNHVQSTSATSQQKISKYQQLTDADLQAVLPQYKTVLQQFYAASKALGQELSATKDINVGDNEKFFSSSTPHRQALELVLSSFISLFQATRIAEIDSACRRNSTNSSPLGQFLSTDSVNMIRQRSAFELLCIKLIDVFCKQSSAAGYVLFATPLYKILTVNENESRDNNLANNISDTSVTKNCCVTLRIMLELVDFVDKPTLRLWAQKVCAVKQDAWKPALQEGSDQASSVELTLLIAQAATLATCST